MWMILAPDFGCVRYWSGHWVEDSEISLQFYQTMHNVNTRPGVKLNNSMLLNNVCSL